MSKHDLDPTQRLYQASKRIGGDPAFVEWLKEHRVMDCELDHSLHMIEDIIKVYENFRDHPDISERSTCSQTQPSADDEP